jgi:hypothetical protein
MWSHAVGGSGGARGGEGTSLSPEAPFPGWGRGMNRSRTGDMPGLCPVLEQNHLAAGDGIPAGRAGAGELGRRDGPGIPACRRHRGDWDGGGDSRLDRN